MIIGIDIDDTMSYTFEETFPRAKKYAKEVLGKEVKEDDYSNCDHYDYIEKTLEISPEEMETFWKENLENLIKTVKPKENVSEIINKLKKEGHKIIVITARWNVEYCDSKKNSKEWLEKHNIPYDKLYIGAESKKEIAVSEKLDLFIDDSIRNCREVSGENIKCLLFESAVNIHSKEIKSFESVKSWNEIYDKINKEEE